jgi:hypothetical protein
VSGNSIDVASVLIRAGWLRNKRQRRRIGQCHPANIRGSDFHPDLPRRANTNAKEIRIEAQSLWLSGHRLRLKGVALKNFIAIRSVT